MTGGVVLVVVIILFICVIIGFNNDVKQRVEARERKEASERRINNLLNSLPYAQTTNEAYNIFTALSAEYRSFYNSGYYFQGYRQVDRIIAKAEKIYLARCKELQPKPKKREKKITDYVQITSDYFNQIRFELGIMYMDAKPDKDGLYTVLKSDLIEAEKSKIESDEMQRILSISSEYYANGLNFEKSGEIDNAIEEYEKSIALEHTWVHSFVRLARIYEHREMYSDMVRVCKLGIKNHSGFSPLDNLINEINEKYVIDWDIE